MHDEIIKSLGDDIPVYIPEDINEKHKVMVDFLSKPGSDILESLSPKKCHLWHAGTLLSSESGELLGAIKAHIIYGKPLDVENVVEELGDIEFALAMIRKSIDVSRETVLRVNIDKLTKKRYPNGYSDQAAIERADKTIS